MRPAWIQVLIGDEYICNTSSYSQNNLNHESVPGVFFMSLKSELLFPAQLCTTRGG